MAKQLIDLSHPLEAGTPPWPGNPPTTVDLLSTIPPKPATGVIVDPDPDAPVVCNVSAFRTCNHTGTHMDAPAHFYNEVATIDQVPLDHCIGTAVLIDVRQYGARDQILPIYLEQREEEIEALRKVVFMTAWDNHWGHGSYFREYPVLSEGAVEWLVERRVHLVGIDTPSVDYPPHSAHYRILGSGAVIVENLTALDRIKRDVFDLIVAPLKLRGLEASVVRAVAQVDV